MSAQPATSSSAPGESVPVEAVPMQPTPRERPLDSPWFWICLFASVAAVALVAIGPKYRQREARLESTFAMREHLTRRNAGEAGADEAEFDSIPAAEDEGLLRTTGPLIWILLAAAAGSCAMLMRTKIVRPNA